MDSLKNTDREKNEVIFVGTLNGFKQFSPQSAL